MGVCDQSYPISVQIIIIITITTILIIIILIITILIIIIMQKLLSCLNYWKPAPIGIKNKRVWQC